MIEFLFKFYILFFTIWRILWTLIFDLIFTQQNHSYCTITQSDKSKISRRKWTNVMYESWRFISFCWWISYPFRLFCYWLSWFVFQLDHFQTFFQLDLLQVFTKNYSNFMLIFPLIFFLKTQNFHAIFFTTNPFSSQTNSF